MSEIDTDGDGSLSRAEFIANGGEMFPDTDIVKDLK